MGLDAEAVPEGEAALNSRFGIRPVFVYILLIQWLNINFSQRADRRSCHLGLFDLTKGGNWEAVGRMHKASLYDIFERRDISGEARIDLARLGAANDRAQLDRELPALREQRAVSFNLRPVSALIQGYHERLDVLPERLTAGNDHKLPMAALFGHPSFDIGNDFVRADRLALARVVGIAGGALEIAAGKADEDGRRAGKRPFALDRWEAMVQLKRALRMDEL